MRGAIVAAVILQLSVLAAPVRAGHNSYVEFPSPTLRNGGHELIRIDTSPDFPVYGGKGWYALPDVYPVAAEAALGNAAVAYQSGSSLVFEVMWFHANAYLNAIVYYDDGRTPSLFIKQGQGAVFKEEPIAGRWTPERLFPGFKGQRTF